MKKVAFYVNMPSPYRVDFFNDLGRYCDLYVFFEMDKSSTRNNSWQSYDFKNFKAVFLKGKPYSGEAAFCPSIVREYKKIKPDINVVCDFSSLTGIKLINYFVRKHIDYFIEGDGAFDRKDRNFIKKYIKNKTFSNAKKLFYTSTEHLNYLLSHKASRSNAVFYPFSSVRQKEICNIQEIFEKKEDQKRALGISNKFTIITVSRFLKLKNIELLLEAFKRFDSDSQLIVIGGKPTSNYEAIVQQCSIKNVKFIDFLNKDLLFKYLRASDLFVFTSLLDVWGLVINEAMANGLPIVSSDKTLSAVQMSQNNKGIFLYNAGSLDQLISKIALIKGFNKEQLMLCSESNLTKIKDYTIEKMCEAHINELDLIQ